MLFTLSLFLQFDSFLRLESDTKITHFTESRNYPTIQFSVRGRHHNGKLCGDCLTTLSLGARSRPDNSPAWTDCDPHWGDLHPAHTLTRAAQPNTQTKETIVLFLLQISCRASRHVEINLF